MMGKPPRRGIPVRARSGRQPALRRPRPSSAPVRPETPLRRPPDRLVYRVREVAEILGMAERTVWRWLREGKVGGATLIPADEVERLIRCESTTADPDVDRVAREMLG